MPVAIRAAQKELSSVFSNDFAFSIPAYQRPYAWTMAFVSAIAVLI
ncbi:MAG: hypothetical protein RMY29_002925 [Nostoc sp. CreGUA01]|nr:hypothetical protein [Nostoc sp. CreGUA01]